MVQGVPRNWKASCSSEAKVVEKNAKFTKFSQFKNEQGQRLEGIEASLAISADSSDGRSKENE